MSHLENMEARAAIRAETVPETPSAALRIEVRDLHPN
jgi:hypothetical protein